MISRNMYKTGAVLMALVTAFTVTGLSGCKSRTVSNEVTTEYDIQDDYNDEVILSFKIDVSDLSSFDRYKLDWYVGFFLDINFSNFSKINEYVNNNPNYMGDVSYYLYYFNGYLVIDIIVFTDRDDEFENLVLNCIRKRYLILF